MATQAQPARTGRRNSLRPMVRLFIALAVAVAVGTAFVLGLAAMLGIDWDPRGSVIIAIAAVWIPQTLITAARYRRR